jgi:biopolymer transport protein ExbB
MTKHAPLVLTFFILSAMLLCPANSSCNDNVSDLISIGPGTLDKNASPALPTPAPAPRPPELTSLLDLIKKGGIVGYGIILLSVISLALIIDYAFTIRRGNILPPNDISQLQELVKNPSDDAIQKFEKRKTSFIAKVTIAGLKESPHGYQAMIKAMEDAGEALVSGIARKTEHLNVIGNISPMMGLLVTVIGMLRCFNEIAQTTGAIEPKQLAGGIFEALVTTCMGLIVAIPALYCYAIFRNRVDAYSGEAAQKAEQLVSGFKTMSGSP